MIWGYPYFWKHPYIYILYTFFFVAPSFFLLFDRVNCLLACFWGWDSFSGCHPFNSVQPPRYVDERSGEQYIDRWFGELGKSLLMGCRLPPRFLHIYIYIIHAYQPKIHLSCCLYIKNIPTRHQIASPPSNMVSFLLVGWKLRPPIPGPGEPMTLPLQLTHVTGRIQEILVTVSPRKKGPLIGWVI